MGRALLVTLVALLSFTGVSHAKQGDTYGGVKTGFMLISTSGVEDIIPIGLNYGYEIKKNISIEGEFNYGLLGGKWTPIAGASSIDFKIWTLAGYAVYRYDLDPKIYLKGKAGLLYENVTASTTFGGTTYSATDSDIGLSLGGGAGFKLDSKTSMEAELTIIETDIKYLSFGVIRKF